MNRIADVFQEPSGREEAISWVAGAGFTLALFLGLAHIQNVRAAQPTVQISDLRAVSVPLEPPPPLPRTVEPPKPAENMVALKGIKIERTDSPVHIAVVPPDLTALVPTVRKLPGAVLKFGYLDTQLKPRVGVTVDVRHVYQVSEVDRPPQAIVRVAPAGAAQFLLKTNSLRVVLMFIVDVDGKAVDIRVEKSSGRPGFDELFARTVQDRWEFLPAIRRGKKVRCLVDVPFILTAGGGNPFGVK